MPDSRPARRGDSLSTAYELPTARPTRTLFAHELHRSQQQSLCRKKETLDQDLAGTPPAVPE